MNEHQRILNNEQTEPLRGPAIVVKATCLNAELCLGRVKEVMKCISHPTLTEPWPSDDEWFQRLPEWFKDPFRNRTIEQVLANECLWDYGSWLDAMRHRGWEWWNVSCNDDSWTATLMRKDLIYSIEPLIYLLRQSGASSITVTERKGESN